MKTIVKPKKVKEKKINKYNIFWMMLEAETGYKWQDELRFHPKRLWRFDFALPELKIAIEIDGGIFASGRHTRGSGQIKDMEKMNNAIILGWVVLHFTPQQLNETNTFEMIAETINLRKKI